MRLDLQILAEELRRELAAARAGLVTAGTASNAAVDALQADLAKATQRAVAAEGELGRVRADALQFRRVGSRPLLDLMPLPGGSVYHEVLAALSNDDH